LQISFQHFITENIFSESKEVGKLGTKKEEILAAAAVK